MTTTEFKHFYGQYIKKKRRENGLSQEECAEVIGISKDALSRIERGINAPNYYTSFALHKHLQLDFDYLFSAYEKYIDGQDTSDSE